jgi:hypothetical protein
MKAFLKWLLALLANPEKPVARVIGFGAAGGALGVTAGTVLGELTQAWYAALIPYMALGAGAAFAAVFVLLGIKTEDVLRCCGVALLAGFFWRPVFDAGKDYLLNQPERAAEAETAKVTETLDSTLAKLVSGPTNTALIEKAGTLAETLTRETAELRRSPANTRAQFAVTRALDVLEDHAKKGHPAALGAVVSVAETAATTGNRTVAEKARLQLATIPATTNTLIETRKREIMTRIPPPR